MVASYSGPNRYLYLYLSIKCLDSNNCSSSTFENCKECCICSKTTYLSRIRIMVHHLLLRYHKCTIIHSRDLTHITTPTKTTIACWIETYRKNIFSNTCDLLVLNCFLLSVVILRRWFFMMNISRFKHQYLHKSKLSVTIIINLNFF